MDNFHALRAQIRAYLVFIILIENAFLVGGLWFVPKYLHVPSDQAALGAYAVSVVMTFIITFAAADYALQPLKAIWRIILHIAPGDHGSGMPNIDQLNVGKTLVSSLSAQIFQISSLADQYTSDEQKNGNLQESRATFIADALPLPLFVLDKNQVVTFANQAAFKYMGQPAEEILNKSVYDVLNMSFTSDDTFDNWLKRSKDNAVTATGRWDRVRVKRYDNEKDLQVDLSAYYNKDNSLGAETILTMFDHTAQYSRDDQAMSLVASAVHELRTPLTMLRGYIEVLDEELAGKISDELTDFIHKMDASAQQLTAFINNMLNVARVEDDQLEVRLQEENWTDVLRGVTNDLSLRAKVRGIVLETTIADNLPTVGVDRLSIYEVLNNLIDNAIKYSGESKKIVISSQLNKDGLVQTTIQDFGVGIPTSAMPNLFSKYYRDHHNRAQVGGTGLGLYLSRAIITAHGGNIWVESTEGKGSTFAFTVLPFSMLADVKKGSSDSSLVRGAHGWIKNHSLYRN